MELKIYSTCLKSFITWLIIIIIRLRAINYSIYRNIRIKMKNLYINMYKTIIQLKKKTKIFYQNKVGFGSLNDNYMEREGALLKIYFFEEVGV